MMLSGLIGSKVVQWALGPAGKIILLVLAFSAWTLYQRHDATRTCEAEVFQEQLIETQRQLVISDRIAQEARERADATEAEINVLEGQLDDFQNAMQSRPGSSCPIPDDLRERLLRIK